MKSEIEKYKSGWYGITLGLGEDDIDNLIEFLKILKKDKSYHFHLFTIDSDSKLEGIADIQFVNKLHTEASNMDIGA